MISVTQRIALGLTFLLFSCSGYTATNTGANLAQNPTVRFEWVKMLRDSDEVVAALSMLDGLQRDFPHDVDYRLARAQLLIRLQRNQEALDELSIASELAPQYEDVWRLRFSLLQADRSIGTAEQHAAVSQEVAERFPHSSWWQTPTNSKATRWTVVLGGGQDSLSNGQSDWSNQFAAIQAIPDDRSFYELQISRDVRFSGGDSALKLGAERKWSDNWFSGVAVGVTADPQFMPEAEFDLHAGRVLSHGWVVDLRYRRRNYDAVNVDTIIGSAERYIDDFRIAYGLGVSRLSGSGSSANHTLTGNWYYQDNANLGLTFSTGEEAEAIGNQQVLRTDVQGLTLSGRHPLTERLNLNWWLGTHEQGDFYRRRYFGLAISIRI